MLWEFNIRIHSDRLMEAKRPGILVIDKLKSKAFVSEDFRVKDEELETIAKYQNLALAISGMWKQG